MIIKHDSLLINQYLLVYHVVFSPIMSASMGQKSFVNSQFDTVQVDAIRLCIPTHTNDQLEAVAFLLAVGSIWFLDLARLYSIIIAIELANMFSVFFHINDYNKLVKMVNIIIMFANLL